MKSVGAGAAGVGSPAELGSVIAQFDRCKVRWDKELWFLEIYELPVGFDSMLGSGGCSRRGRAVGALRPPRRPGFRSTRKSDPGRRGLVTLARSAPACPRNMEAPATAAAPVTHGHEGSMQV